MMTLEVKEDGELRFLIGRKYSITNLPVAFYSRQTVVHRCGPTSQIKETLSSIAPKQGVWIRVSKDSVLVLFCFVGERKENLLG